MASHVSDRHPPPQGRDRRRDSGYRSPSEDSFDSRAGSYYYDDARSQRTAPAGAPPPGAEQKSKADTFTKLAVGAAIVYGVLRIWSGEKNAEKERRRKREKRRDFERRKAARRREDDRREREREREEETGDDESEATEVKRIAYAPARSRSRRAKSRAAEERDDGPKAERSRSRGPPGIGGPPAPPTMTRASNVDGHEYEEHRSKSRTR